MKGKILCEKQKEPGMVKEGDEGSHGAKMERKQVEYSKRREPEAGEGVRAKERSCHSSSYQ